MENRKGSSCLHTGQICQEGYCQACEIGLKAECRKSAHLICPNLSESQFNLTYNLAAENSPPESRVKEFLKYLEVGVRVLRWD